MGSRQSQDTQRAVLVLNGTGKTGRRVVERLQGRGVAVRAGSRSGEPPFHWQDPSTWLAALRGTDAAFISYYPDLAAPGAAEAIAAFSELAVQNGTRRLVLLSGRGEEEAQRSEAVLKESGADWTVVRCSWFMQNFSESYFLEPLLEGELALPADAIREPFVDADDVADVVVAALTDGRHAGQLYELTGPRLLRFDEAVAEIARASGETIRYAPLTIEQFAAGMADGAFRTTSSRCSATSSPRCSTVATLTWPMGSSAPSAGSRATSATTPGTPPRPASGTDREWRPESTPMSISPVRIRVGGES